MLFVVSGPSGCGKSTLIREAIAALEDLSFSVSHTTRLRRPSEKEGEDYYFVSRKVFHRLVREGHFVEWACVHGQFYGTSREEIRAKSAEGDLLLDIDVQGARQVRETLPDAVMIFVMPPRRSELRRRLERRKEDSPGEIEQRLEDAREEVPAYSEFDYVVINDDLERAAEELIAILRASRCSTAERARDLRPILRSFSLPARGKKTWRTRSS